MLMSKPINFEDLRYHRLRSLRDEVRHIAIRAKLPRPFQKLKRRRAATSMPIRITPFYYSTNPVDFLDNSVGSGRTRSSSPYYSSYYGR